MILVVPRIFKWIAGKSVVAISIFPFILLRDRETKYKSSTILHEKIHWHQQIELVLVFFYLLYGLFYLINRLRGYNHFNAYMSIPFEKEAYDNESKENYLKERKFWAWTKFL
jgi:hypothetical protein